MSEKYIDNPKTKGSGIYGAIPQKGNCQMGCEECFFNGGRSYLNPLDENTPNMPSSAFICSKNKIVRVNDGNDSFFLTPDQISAIIHEYDDRCFFNTSVPKDLDKYHIKFEGYWQLFGADPTPYLMPVVLTVNPNKMTDTGFYKVDPIPKNLMFVRFRVNMWNIDLAKQCINYYTQREIPVVLTFMAYYNEDAVPKIYKLKYIWRKRTLNSYWAITTEAWDTIMSQLKWKPHNKWVYSCGQIEGQLGDTHCRFCGTCLREFFATKERLELK